MHLLSLPPFFRARRKAPAKSGAGRSGYCKACNLEDFARPEFSDFIRSAFLHDLVRHGEAFPRGHERRHYWRTALLARTLADHGVLGPDAEVLGVGAGNEPAVFWLTNKARRVFAADRYLEPGSLAQAQCGGMMAAPDRHWPASWNRRRLVVQHMPPHDLRFPDESLDAAFAVGVLDDCHADELLGRTLDELARVLRPGGVLSLTFELRLEGPPAGAGPRLFGEEEVMELLLRGRPWTPLGDVDLAVSEATRQAQRPRALVEEELHHHLSRHHQLLWHELPPGGPPDLALRDGPVLAVPAHLALRKKN
jgi:SAM-dependent methyltransferase